MSCLPDLSLPKWPSRRACELLPRSALHLQRITVTSGFKETLRACDVAPRKKLRGRERHSEAPELVIEKSPCKTMRSRDIWIRDRQFAAPYRTGDAPALASL